MVTVHIIFKAHLDPIWLWPWTAGLDEVLATCRSAVDRLKASPDIHFTRGEAWVYHQIERLDPILFRRIQNLVFDGRWEIVGGWWIQPDCNAPSGFALAKNIQLGKDFFLDRFNHFPTVAMNPDSFGHAATLPGLMAAAGQKYYIYQRPQEHENPIRHRLFRWRGYADGPEVTAFHIAGGYGTFSHDQLEISGEKHLRHALADLPQGIAHTMCFVGLSNHGGGPTERQIAWIREHKSAFHGMQLVFSTTEKFFAAIADQIPSLPLVTGELQMHAIGCYSVHRPVKTAIRKTEHLLHQAGVLAAHSSFNLQTSALKDAWQDLCFHHFHDTLGGTCVPSAYPQVLNQLGRAAATADEQLTLAFRRHLNTLPDDPRQRLCFLNASDRPFDMYTECEPWMGYPPHPAYWHLVDEQDRAVPFQLIAQEAYAACGKIPRILTRLRAAPGQTRILRIINTKGPDFPSRLSAEQNTMLAQATTDSTPGQFPFPTLHLFEDKSDTWTHIIDRYAGPVVASATWEPAQSIDHGPLMASVIQRGRIAESILQAEWRIYAGESPIELRLRVHWREIQKILKASFPLPSSATHYIAGIPGNSLQRPADGRELPLRDFLHIPMENKTSLSIICPDVFAADITPTSANLTLLRSPYLAHHDPYTGPFPRGTVSDQGTHDFIFRISTASSSITELDSAATALQRPLLYADLSRGMSAIT